MAKQTILGSDSGKEALYKLQGNDDELYVTKSEVEDARDGESSLLVKQQAQDSAISTLASELDSAETNITVVTNEVIAARDGESSLLAKQQEQDTRIDNLLSNSGVLVSSADTTIGYLDGKLIADSPITLTKGNTGADETLTVGLQQYAAKFPLVDLPLVNSTNFVRGAGSVTVNRAGAATYIDRYGVVQDLAAGEVGFDADGVDLLPANTNLLLNSQDATQWTKTRVTVDSDVATAPDETRSSVADKIKQSLTAGLPYIYQPITANSTYTYTAVAILKASELSEGLIRVSSDASNYFQFYFSLTNNTVLGTNVGGTGSISDYGIIPLVDNWCLCWITGTPNTSDVNIVGVLIGPNDVDNTNNTDGIYFYRAGLVNLPFYTVPSLTTIAPVASLGTTLQFPYVENFPGSLKDKTVIMDVTVVGFTQTTEDCFNSGDLRLILNSSTDSVQPYVAMNSNIFTPVKQITLQFNETFRYGVTYDSTTLTLRMYINNILIAENTSADSTYNLNNQILIGEDGVYQKIKNLRIYDKTLTEEEMRVA